MDRPFAQYAPSIWTLAEALGASPIPAQGSFFACPACGSALPNVEQSKAARSAVIIGHTRMAFMNSGSTRKPESTLSPRKPRSCFAGSAWFAERLQPAFSGVRSSTATQMPPAKPSSGHLPQPHPYFPGRARDFPDPALPDDP